MTFKPLVLTALLATAAAGAIPAHADDTTAAPAALALGASAPMRGASLKNIDGKEVSLESVAGKKGTLVIFMCNHCPWVKKWQTRIASVGNEATKLGIGVLAINSNDPSAYAEDSYEETQARAKKLGFRFAYAVDGTSDLARAFGATRTPEAFLFDAGGKLVYHGAVDDNADAKAMKEAWLRQAVQAVAAGKPVKMADTKALGCGIKFREKAEKSQS